jgi:hypothetical protein
MAWDTAVVACLQNLRKFSQGKAQLQRALRELNSLDGSGWKDSITATRPLRRGQDAETLVVAERIRTDPCQAGKFSRT